MRRQLYSLILLLAVACATTERQSPQTADSLVEPPDLREKGLLLLMADRRYYDPFTVGSIRFGNPELRQPLARSLGRIGDSRGLPALRTLLLDDRPEVRREAAFAIGLLRDPAARTDLLAAASDADEETAVWAVAGLADMGSELQRVVDSMAGLPPAARWRRLSPYLFRFPTDQVLSLAGEGLESSDDEVRAMTLYALAREPRPGTADLLRPHLTDRDSRISGWAAQALGRIGGRSDLPRLRDLVAGGAPYPRMQALRAAHQLIGAGLAPAPEDWIPLLLELFADPHPGVALTAMEASAAWLLDEALGDALSRRVESGVPREQEVALSALAAGGDPRAGDYASRLANSSSERQRMLAATVAGRLGDGDLLEILWRDPSPQVREAALAGILGGSGDFDPGLASLALEDPDPGVRALVMQWLIENPLAPADQISRAILGPGAREVVESRLFGTRALLARGLQEPLERGLVVQNLESLARVGEYPARRQAIAALGRLDRPEPPIGAAGSHRSTETYMQMVLRTDRQLRVEIETPLGVLVVELDCPTARASCLNFLQLAEQGYFDGQSWHRVVPGVLVQSGDPRGDGWGGPGYTLRDELSRRPFARGVVGIASSVPDAAGSQFFITLSRQPQLDGRYTALGRVVGGEEILDQLMQGDRLERVRVVR